MTHPVRMIFVGGFLGAGKTTLLWRCAELLLKRGQRVGLITNDQAPDLVDTHQLQMHGVMVGEVAGSCFCCNFPALLNAAERVGQKGGHKGAAPADVLIAEPVGSCTDLSATILQPLKDKYRDAFTVSPLTVLTDPQRLLEIHSGEGDTLHRDAAYIFRKQLEEADIIAINKIDTLSPRERQAVTAVVSKAYPDTEMVMMSAQRNEGVESWLDSMLLRPARDAGRRIVQVNYDRYAHGEAVLGWLNASIELKASKPVDWTMYAASLLEMCSNDFAARHADVGHVKLWLTSEKQELVGNLTRTSGQPVIRSSHAPRGYEAHLVLNARVEMPPAELEAIVRNALQANDSATVRASIAQLRCFQPGYPKPTHRYAEVVSA